MDIQRTYTGNSEFLGSIGSSTVFPTLESTHHDEAEDEQTRVALAAKPHPFTGAVLSPKHARELTPSLCLAIASALAEQSQLKAAIPYTLWITEAWRVLGWAEPSACLFWEMASMFQTLYLAARAFAADYREGCYIPPILSCGSTSSSMGSGTTQERSLSYMEKKRFSSAASAKELPVWLIGTFLLLHCEEVAYQRNLSGQDESRYSPGGIFESAALDAGKTDFTSLFRNPSLSPRTRIHAGWNHDNTHCTAYLLRHLRKILLLTSVSHNEDAIRALMHLAALPSPPPLPPSDRFRRLRNRYSADELRRQHEEEHANVGVGVHLSMDDLERLHLIIQPPSGGGIEEPPLKIGEYIFQQLYGAQPPPMATIPLADVEREITRHLELELLMSDVDQGDRESISSSDGEDATMSAFAKMSLTDRPSASDDDDDAAAGERAKQPHQQYLKELSYTHLRSTTILLKPNMSEISSGASSESGDANTQQNSNPVGRLHDLAISDCSDAHFYLLQPFEHATISCCTGCTIIVGAVAGLVHIVDCENSQVTVAARRILVSNSCNVQIFAFSPTPPLLVGDNRSCQFAPHNTYYDGFREDLLATGLAATLLPESQSPYHGSRASDSESAWPPLTCASNKWKQPIELSKLEVPQIPSVGTPSSSPSTLPSAPGADDKVMNKSAGNDATMHSPVLLPASDFHILFVPIESEAARQRRVEQEENEAPNEAGLETESLYCQCLAEVLQFSPFRLPSEYERRVLARAERIRTIQQAVKALPGEHQGRVEEELNRGFRDWLVTSGNLRQVLDLVHLEKRGGV